MSTTNKLRKQPAEPTIMSRTLAVAMRSMSPTRRGSKAAYLEPLSQPAQHHPEYAQPVPTPRTAAEQYWAARALKAETLLGANEVHRQEVKALAHVQEEKRQKELNALGEEYKAKHTSLERLIIILLCLIVLLIILVIYLATHYSRQSFALQHKKQDGWWSLVGASHFTIPILSPFTSVVEHEHSVIGAKIIGTVAAILACLGYFVFRHWLKNSMATSKPPQSQFARIPGQDVVSRFLDR